MDLGIPLFDVYVGDRVTDTWMSTLNLKCHHTFKADDSIYNEIALYLAAQGTFCKTRIRWDDETYDAGLGAMIEALPTELVDQAHMAAWTPIGYVDRINSKWFVSKDDPYDILIALAEKVTIESMHASTGIRVTFEYQGESCSVYSKRSGSSRKINQNLALWMACKAIAAQIDLCALSDSFDRVNDDQVRDPEYLMAHLLAGGKETRLLSKAINVIKTL